MTPKSFARVALPALALAGCVDIPGFGGEAPRDGAGGDGAKTGDGSVPHDGGLSDATAPLLDAPGTLLDAPGTPPDGPSMPAVQPSCAGLTATCGPQGTSSCCERQTVDASTFKVTNDLAKQATVRAFQLDSYEITVGRFRKFVEAGGGVTAGKPAAGAGAHPWIAGSGWRTAYDAYLEASRAALESSLACDAWATWTATAGANESRPITCITWYEAMAFCAWDNGFLPTEVEWDAAAEGGAQQRYFPWSNPPSSMTITAAHASARDASGCNSDGNPACTVTDLLRVGSRPDGRGRWGHSDLTGNAMEWVLDETSTFPSPCVDCANVATGNSSHLSRGGSFAIQPSLLPKSRFSLPATHRGGAQGARCARPL